jgi:4-amino-4-deoxy-L-arabinose transferase-like glycosyltransferase
MHGSERYDAETMSLEELEQKQGTRTGRRWVVWAALAAGLALRVWFVRRYAYVSVDAMLYGDFAQNLLKHGVYGYSDTVKGLPVVKPTLIRLPGYPLFLLICFAIFGVGKFEAVMLVQVALDLATCLLLLGTARRMFGERAGLAALLLAALCPFMANYTAAPLTETPTLFCMALAFYGLVRWQDASAGVNRWVGVIGLALAWAVLLRPEQGLLAAAVVPAMGWIGYKNRSKGVPTPDGRHFVRYSTLRVWRGALLVSCLTLLPLVPWTVRNWRTMHVFQPLAPKFATDPGEFNPYGFQRWYRTWAIDFASTDQVYWPYNGDPISIADLPNRAFDSNEQYAETEAVIADYDLTTTATPALDKRFAAIAEARVKADPLRYYLALPVARVVNMIFRPRVDFLPVPLEWWKFRLHKRATVFASGYALLNLGYLVVAAIGFSRRGAWERYEAVVWAMGATIVLRCLLLLTIDNSEPRYTLEFYPVLVVMASGVVSGWFRSSSISPVGVARGLDVHGRFP